MHGHLDDLKAYEEKKLQKGRYEELTGFRQDNFIKSKYTIYERDKFKETRITILDSLTGAIIKITK